MSHFVPSRFRLRLREEQCNACGQGGEEGMWFLFFLLTPPATLLLLLNPPAAQAFVIKCKTSPSPPLTNKVSDRRTDILTLRLNPGMSGSNKNPFWFPYESGQGKVHLFELSVNIRYALRKKLRDYLGIFPSMGVGSSQYQKLLYRVKKVSRLRRCI